MVFDIPQAARLIHLNMTEPPRLTNVTEIPATETSDGLLLSQYSGRYRYPVRLVAACAGLTQEHPAQWSRVNGTSVASCDDAIMKRFSALNRSVCMYGGHSTIDLLLCSALEMLHWNLDPIGFVSESTPMEPSLWPGERNIGLNGENLMNEKCVCRRWHLQFLCA